MKCPSCNKSANITIGTKHYCTDCGERMTMATPPASTVVRSLDLSRAPSRPAAPATPRRKVASPVVAPIPSSRLMRDVVGTGGVLDLRQTAPAPAAPTPREQPKHVAIAASKMHSPAKVQTEIPTPSDQSKRQRDLQNRLETAVKVGRSSSISRFTVPTDPLVVHHQKPLPTQPEPIALPHQAAAQHEHLGRLLELAAETAPTGSPSFTKPSRASFAAAAAAIAIMSGYIWVHNYPHLAMTTAASQAGFSASLPNFIPSSYSLSGSPTYSPGLVTLSFNSPSFSDPLKVTQQPTTWDSSSLLDNYVAAKTSDYSTVSGQGLTIYLLNGNQQAAWINHGIWYTVEGATHLGRDQLLKMAYSF